jgi:hypothetical protein
MPYPLREPGPDDYGQLAALRVLESDKGIAMLDGSAAGALQPAGPGADVEPADGTSGVRPSLPIGAVLLAILQVAEGAWLLAAFGGVRIAAEAGLPADLLGLGAAGGYVIVAVAVLRFAAALGLLARVRAAWVLVMLITGGGLALTITGYALGMPDDVRLLLDVASAFYLNQPGVRAVYGIQGGQPR